MTWEKEIKAMNSERKETAIYTSMWLDLNNSFGHIESNGQASYRFSDDKSETCLKSALAALEERKNDPENKEKQDKFKEEKKNYDKAVKELLKNNFIPNVGAKQKECFEKKYDMAVSGSGNESFKITTLHSSSLCCLLFFYNVNDNNPLILPLTTNKGNKTVKFTKSVFEFKNKVISGRSPSNVDVVLVGKIIEGEEGGGKDVILFLESKFAEYYLSAENTCDIGKGYLTNEIGAELYKIKDDLNNDLNNDLGSMDYGKSYDLDGLKGLEVTIEKNKQKKNGKDKDVYKIQSNIISYIDGIKQMISHYIGIKNLIHKDFYKSKLRQAENKRLTENEKNIRELEEKIQTPIEEAINTGNCIVILGEIAFELPNGDAKDALKKYRDNYKLLAKIIASHEKDNSRFEILNELLSYSEFKTNEFTVDEKIKAFYRMN